MFIDAHHHLWKHNDRDYGWMTSPGFEPLQRDYLVADLVEATRTSGVDATIAVQARQTLEETEWLLEIAAQSPLVQGVVGWVPLCAASVRSDLERFAHDAKFRGVRHILHDEPDDLFMLRPDFNQGVGALKSLELLYDILIFERHLPQAIEFVDRHPQQVFVLDHIAKPKIKQNLIEPWASQIHQLAKRENVYCKVSGIATEADWAAWTTEQLRVYFDVVLAAFGPSRLMFGSDWPVLTLAGSYSTWVDTFRSLIAQLTPDEQIQISAETARAVYRI